jgi:adenosylcobinamide-GDP ribazoletransferase
MRRALDAALLAMEFLTVVRVRRRNAAPGRGVVGLSLLWFPAVGLLVGIFLAAAAWLASRVWSLPVAVALVLALNAAVTGGLHLDGLADCADGIFGGHMPEQRLAIMRDSRIGTFGVLALVLVLLLQFAALSMLSSDSLRAVLLTAPLLGRLAMVLCIQSFRYARPSGLGVWYKEELSPSILAGAVLVALALLTAVTGLRGVLLLPSLLIAIGAAAFASRRLGGLTGDVYGACGVLVETALILTVAAWPDCAWLAPWLGG